MGTGDDGSRKGAARVVETAYDLGIRFFDTAEAYGTEGVIGSVLGDLNREDLVLCSKLSCFVDGDVKSPDQIQASLEASLNRLKSDYLDIYYCHGILPDNYDSVKERVLPVLKDFKKQGLIKQIGISEMFGGDTGHVMLAKAVDERCWDAVMVGYNLMNQSAAPLLTKAGEKGIFRVNMFAVRRALINNESFGEYIDRMINEGKLTFTHSQFYEFKRELFGHGDSVSLPNLAYRFVKDSGLFDVVLSGTGNLEHLTDNVTAFESPPLAGRIVDLLHEFFEGEMKISAQEGYR